jgi:type I restriction enzyme S subunit
MDLLQNGFKGSTIKHISKEYVLDIEIPVPDISIQKQNIEFCVETDKFIIGLKLRIAKLGTYSSMIFKNYLGKKE